MEILIKCFKNPTEDTKKVAKAIENLTGRLNLEAIVDDDLPEITCSYKNRDAIDFVRQKIHEKRIIDAARKRLEANWNGISTKICFDKQAAFVKKVRIIDDDQESPPLGNIEIILFFDSDSEFEEFVTWFTPPTVDGRIINH